MRPFRIIADIVVFVSIFWLPWPIFIVLGCLCVFLFENYIEFVIAALIFDSLYSVSTVHFMHIQFLATIIALAVLIIAGGIKKQLRVHLYL